MREGGILSEKNVDDSMGGGVDKLVIRLAASEVGEHFRTAASKASAHAAAVFAYVIKRADQRAGDLAEAADQARTRGVTCEQVYDGLSHSSGLH